MVTHTLTETYDNDAHFDLTYIICVWITFLPTVTLPWFYAHWVLIGSLSRRFVMAELFWPGSPNQRQKMAEQEREIFGDTVAHRHRYGYHNKVVNLKVFFIQSLNFFILWTKSSNRPHCVSE